MSDPYASMMLYGEKTLETRNRPLFKGVQGLCLVQIGRRVMDEAVAGEFLWKAGFPPAKIQGFMVPPRGTSCRGQLCGVVELGETRQLSSPEMSSKDIQRRVCAVDVGTYATEVLNAWWLKKPIRQRGFPNIWQVSVDIDDLPPEVAERLEASRPAFTPKSSNFHRNLEDEYMYPELVVFDLDGVCWSPEMYQTRGGPPYRLKKNRMSVLNSNKEEIRLFEAVPNVWQQLFESETRIAVASSSQRRKALPLLDTFPVLPGVSMANCVDELEMYYAKGEGKRPHIQEILKRNSDWLDPKKVLFMDDARENINSVKDLGITAVHMPRGLTERAWLEALDQYWCDQEKR